ncbi:MAG TPA: glycosyltransferase family 2 protein [Longimicrobiales bacterium]
MMDEPATDVLVERRSAPRDRAISVIVPVYNEALNVDDVHARLAEVLQSDDVEFIFIDDGSTDGTADRLHALAALDSRVKVIRLRRNYGQTAALSAGIDHARGRIIVPIDGDLQNDPRDIPRLLARLNEGYDVVSGWRVQRKDPLHRRLPSVLANRLISSISGVRLHDYGCSLKAYRKSVLRDVRLYGEMHRFVPIYASWQGARVTELPVNHYPRTRGKSNYGIERTIKVVLDLLVVKFLATYATKPIYVFGGFGLVAFLLGSIAALLMFYFKFTGQKSFIETPLPLVTVMFFLVGCLSVLLGLVAELTIRTYYESQGKRTYSVRPVEEQ